MRNRTLALILVAAIGVVAAAFWWLDFRAATEQFKNESQVATYRFNNQQEKPAEGMQPKRDLALYVTGDGELEDALRNQLEKTLESSPSFGDVEALTALPDRMDRAVLLVEWGDGSLTWTPVYSTAQFQVNVTYASDGEVAWRHDKVVRMSGSGERVVRVRGEYQVTDTAKGVVSHPSYQRQLGEQIASEVAKSLESALKNTPGGLTQRT